MDRLPTETVTGPVFSAREWTVSSGIIVIFVYHIITDKLMSTKGKIIAWVVGILLVAAALTCYFKFFFVFGEIGE